MSELNPNLISEPGDDPTQTPDQQAASGQSYGDQSSILGLLGSMQNSRAGMTSLLPQPVSQAGVYAGALSGGVSAMRGTPDPVQQIQKDSYTQQMGIMQMVEKMQAGQDLNNYRMAGLSDRDRQFRLEQKKFQNLQSEQVLKKNEAALVTMRGILDNENTPPATLAVIGPQYAAQMEKTFGVKIPTTVVERRMKVDEQNQVLMDLQNGLPPEIILKNHPALTPEDLQAYTGIKDNPTVLERLKLKSPKDREEQVLRIRGLNADLLEKEHPELRLDPKTGAAVLMKAQLMYPNQTYADLTTIQRGRLYSLTVLEQQSTALAQERAKTEMQEQVRMANLPRELAIRGAAALSLEQAKNNFKTVGDSKEYYVNTKGDIAPSDMTIPEARKGGYNVMTQVQVENLKTGQQAMLILSNIKDTVKEMKDENLFVTKSGLAGLFQQGMIAARGKVGDPETSKRLLGNLETQKGHMIILMRLLGEKGVKAMTGLLPSMEILNPAKGAPAIEQFLGNLESEIRILAENSKASESLNHMPTLFPQRPRKDNLPTNLTAPSNEWKIEEVK